MLVRDCEGRLIIISRNDCKNETVYNEKLYNIRLAYTQKYKSVIVNPPKDKDNNNDKNKDINNTNINIKDIFRLQESSDD
jgi:hypothetical protein